LQLRLFRLLVSAIVIASLALPTTLLTEPKKQFEWIAAPLPCSEETGQPCWSQHPPGVFDKWSTAILVTGYATTYDAFYTNNTQSWYSLGKSGKPGKNGYLVENKETCEKNPGWKCFVVDMGTWVQYRRKWTATTENLYAALGPHLRGIIGKQMPRHHSIPVNKLRITSLQTNISVEVWITDYCPCIGYVVSGGKKVHPLVDLSPQAWAEMGREEYYVNGKRYYRDAATGGKWSSNWITVEYLP